MIGSVGDIMKRYFLVIMFLIISFSFYDVHALKSGSSELTGRSVCDKFELALANADDSITSVGCYTDYTRVIMRLFWKKLVANFGLLMLNML